MTDAGPVLVTGGADFGSDCGRLLERGISVRSFSCGDYPHLRIGVTPSWRFKRQAAVEVRWL